MSVGGLIVALLLVLIVLAVLSVPYVRQRPEQGQLSRQRERALAYYERVVSNMRDLDEDYATGKMASDEYQNERAVWAERGVRLLRLFDELDAQHSLVADVNATDAHIDATIEAAILSLRDESELA